jgi:hypothetical protein
MPAIRRRLIQVEKRIVKAEGKDDPRWLIVHSSYSDGGEVYEVYSMQGASGFRRFSTESEMDAWLSKHRNTTVDWPNEA